MAKLGSNSFLGSTTVGERGQVVIPAEARKAYGIEIGDKLLVFSRHRHAGLLLVKAELINQLVSDAFAEATQLEKLLEVVYEEAPVEAEGAPASEGGALGLLRRE